MEEKKDWGFWEPIDQKEILEEMKNYQSTLDEHTKNLLADTMKRAREKENN